MSESLGLSIGVANLVAARSGGVPIARSSVLSLFEQRPTEIGLPEENPNLTEPGLVLRGFVERVGDRAPLVASDGTKYLGAALTVEAIEAMARTAGYGAPIVIAVPAYWSDVQFTALREEFVAQPDLVRDGVAPTLVSDATAALAALRGTPDFPTDGVIALCDFGAGGSTVTLMNGGSNFEHIGKSARYLDFSGDAIDQLIVDHLRASDVSTGGLSGTARIASQARLLGASRRAKEQLSTATDSTVTRASGEDAQLTRSEFDELISQPLHGFLVFVGETLRHNGIKRPKLAAVAIVGGGANIPLLTARLSERFEVPIHTATEPAFSAAIGATLLGAQQAPAADSTTASPAVEMPTAMVGVAGLDMTQAAPAQGADMTQAAPAQGADMTQSMPKTADTERALAWSEDDDAADEPVPYTGRDATGEYFSEASEFDDDDDRSGAPDQLPWYKRTALVFAIAAAVVAVLVALVLAIEVALTRPSPVNPTPPVGPVPPQTVTVVPSPPTTTEPTTTTPPPPTTTEAPPPTTTYAPPAPTTTYSPPTTTQDTYTPPPTRERPLWPRPFRRWP
jgi:actin-like ATPase involved in cell morphogenesis